MLRHFSHVWLFATPWTIARQAPLAMGFSRQEYWRRSSSSRGSSQPRDWTHISCSSCTVGRFFIVESLGKLYVNAILNSRTSWKNMAKDKSQWHSNQPLVNQPACLLRVEWARYHNPQMVLPVRFFRECFQTFVRSQKPTFSLGLMLQAFNKGFGI